MSPTSQPLPISTDVAIIGDGPSGRWLAAHLSTRGVQTLVVDPSPRASWENTYGLWVDEVAGLTPTIPTLQRFSAPVVILPKATHELHRTYGLIDNRALSNHIDRLLDDAGVHRITGTVTGLKHLPDQTSLHLLGGREIQCQLAVVCSGAASYLLTHRRATQPSFQRAYGLLGRFKGDPLDGHSMVLMDYRRVPGAPPLESPTFLYGMHLGDDRYFVEETVLTGPQSIGFDDLKSRLHRRLRLRGTTIVEVEDEERCHIPMGDPLPDLQQPVLGFGAAAGFVHPATGYQMARMFRAGEDLATIISDGLTEGAGRDVICRRGWAALWPESLVRARDLLLFGRNVLLSFHEEEIQSFFDAFFSLPDGQWQAYLSGEAGHHELTAIMVRLFAQAPMKLRLKLMKQAFGDTPRVFRALGPTHHRGWAHG